MLANENFPPQTLQCHACSRFQVNKATITTKKERNTWSDSRPRRPRTRVMASGLVTIALSIGRGAAALRFGAPAIVGQDNYATGFQGFGDGKHALGKADGGWYGTSDGGKSWDKVLGGQDVNGDVHAAVISGRIMHNLGTVAAVADKRGSYYTFNSSSAEYFSVQQDLPLAFAATSRPTPVIFRGLPQSATCGNPKRPGLFGCPFRTGGRGVVRLAGLLLHPLRPLHRCRPNMPPMHPMHPNTIHLVHLVHPVHPMHPCRAFADGVLVMSIIIYWGGAHASPDAAVAHSATSVVAYRATDGVGLTWEYAGIILDAASAPESEEGPNENDLAIMADGRILCVLRLDAGDGARSRPYRPYVRSVSSDGGLTWSVATPLGEG